LILVDQIAARFGVLLVDETVADGPDAAADAVARVGDGHGSAHRSQVAGRGQPRESSAGDEHGHAVERHLLKCAWGPTPTHPCVAAFSPCSL